jgi:hypothetical protein
MEKDASQVAACRERLDTTHLDKEEGPRNRHCQGPRVAPLGGSLRGQFAFSFTDYTEGEEEPLSSSSSSHGSAPKKAAAAAGAEGGGAEDQVRSS